MKERLDKFISSQTALSRKEVRRAVKDKRVTLNGSVVKSADVKIDAQSDSVALDGAVITYKEHVYYMLNKPSGVVSATEDRVEKTVIDILPPELRRAGLFPAGRLDKDTTGVVLVAKNRFSAEMLNRQIRNKEIKKTYMAICCGILENDGTIEANIKKEMRSGNDMANTRQKIYDGVVV